MTVDEVKIVLAKESKMKALEVKIANLQGVNNAKYEMVSRLNSEANNYAIEIANAQKELEGLKNDGTPTPTSEFGERSIVDNASAAERTAGQIAAITAIKQDPDITEEEIKTIWNQAALASRPANRQWLLNSTDSLLQEYYANLLAIGAITEATWENFRNWIYVTPVEVITNGNPK